MRNEMPRKPGFCRGPRRLGRANAPSTLHFLTRVLGQGQVGKQENCWVAVSLSVSTDPASLPIAWRLYLPHEWADDQARRKQAGVPGEIQFETKPVIALQQIRRAVEQGVPQ